MSKLVDILEDCSGINRDEDGNRCYYEWEILDAMKEAAEEAFNAGKNSGFELGYSDGFSCGFESSCEIDEDCEDLTFEDYLKEIV